MKEATYRYLAALLFDGLSNIKFAELKTDITNRALQGKYAVPKSYGMVLKFVSGWRIRASHSNSNIIEEAQPCTSMGMSWAEAAYEVAVTAKAVAAQAGAETADAVAQTRAAAKTTATKAVTKLPRPIRSQKDHQQAHQTAATNMAAHTLSAIAQNSPKMRMPNSSSRWRDGGQG